MARAEQHRAMTKSHPRANCPKIELREGETRVPQFRAGSARSGDFASHADQSPRACQFFPPSPQCSNNLDLKKTNEDSGSVSASMISHLYRATASFLSAILPKVQDRQPNPLGPAVKSVLDNSLPFNVLEASPCGSRFYSQSPRVISITPWKTTTWEFQPERPLRIFRT